MSTLASGGFYQMTTEAPTPAKIFIMKDAGKSAELKYTVIKPAPTVTKNKTKKLDTGVSFLFLFLLVMFLLLIVKAKR